MSKLLKLKQWVTLSEAAQSLCLLAGEDVSEADLVRLAIEGELVLSVRFVNGAYFREWVVLKPLEAESQLNCMPMPDDFLWAIDPDGGVVTMCFDSAPMQLQGSMRLLHSDVWDLPMIGSEVDCLEREYQRLVGGPERKVASRSGICVRSASGRLFEVQVCEGDSPRTGLASDAFRSPKDFSPVCSFPEDAALVVRTASLRALQEKLTEPESGGGKPMGELSTKERATLLKLVIGMAIGGYGYDPYAKKSETPTQIASDMESREIKLNPDTVRKWLKTAAREFLPHKPSTT